MLRAAKEITLVISNKDMNDIIRIIKSLEKSGILLDGVTSSRKWSYLGQSNKKDFYSNKIFKLMKKFQNFPNISMTNS